MGSRRILETKGADGTNVLEVWTRGGREGLVVQNVLTGDSLNIPHQLLEDIVGEALRNEEVSKLSSMRGSQALTYLTGR